MKKRIAWIRDSEQSSGGRFVPLPHPQTGQLSQYLLRTEETSAPLCQIQSIEGGDYKSWFHGNSVISDGSLIVVVPIDPLFLLLPLLHAHHLQQLATFAGSASSSSSTSQKDALTEDVAAVPWERLEDLLYDPNCPSLVHLARLQDIEKQMTHIADTQDLGENGLLVRFNPTKALAFLKSKIEHLRTHLTDALVSSLAYRQWSRAGLQFVSDQRTQIALSILTSHLDAHWATVLIAAYADPSLQAANAPSSASTTGTLEQEAMAQQENQSQIGNYQSPAAFKRSYSGGASETGASENKKRKSATLRAPTPKDLRGMKSLSSFFGKKA